MKSSAWFVIIWFKCNDFLWLNAGRLLNMWTNTTKCHQHCIFTIGNLLNSQHVSLKGVKFYQCFIALSIQIELPSWISTSHAMLPSGTYFLWKEWVNWRILYVFWAIESKQWQLSSNQPWTMIPQCHYQQMPCADHNAHLGHACSRVISHIPWCLQFAFIKKFSKHSIFFIWFIFYNILWIFVFDEFHFYLFTV